MPNTAVITGDIVNSTKLSSAKEKKLYGIIQQIFAAHKFDFYRGDSFQAYIKTPSAALNLALQCRTAAIAATPEELTDIIDVRISIGIGSVETPVRSLKTAKGDAFISSGRIFDEMAKAGSRLAITAGDKIAGQGLEVIADYINAIFKDMTVKQAEAIHELLKGSTQQNVSDKFRKTKSTISQRVSSGRWTEIEKLLRQYETIIKYLP